MNIKKAFGFTFALLLSLSLLSGTAEAARGGGHTSGGSGSLSLVLLSSTDGLAHYGQYITFNVSTTLASPYVDLQCFQNGVMVAEGWEGFFVGALSDRVFGLYSPQWLGGAADCTAYLSYQTKRGWQRVASTSFHAEP
jgi:hypothetical protein